MYNSALRLHHINMHVVVDFNYKGNTYVDQPLQIDAYYRLIPAPPMCKNEGDELALCNAYLTNAVILDQWEYPFHEHQELLLKGTDIIWHLTNAQITEIEDKIYNELKKGEV
jgi:hypothetical protein